MKILILILILVGAGYGQLKATSISEERALNTHAKWVEVTRSIEDNEPMAVDTRTIYQNEDALVFFRVRYVLDLGGTHYMVVGANCMNGEYVFTNIWREMPSGKLVKIETGLSETAKAEKNTVMYHAIKYACNYKKEDKENLKYASIPLTIY